MIIKEYDENLFLIDLIIDSYKIKDPFTIKKRMLELFKIQIPISDIIEYLNDIEIEPNVNEFSINSKDLFQS